MPPAWMLAAFAAARRASRAVENTTPRLCAVRHTSDAGPRSAARCRPCRAFPRRTRPAARRHYAAPASGRELRAEFKALDKAERSQLEIFLHNRFFFQTSFEVYRGLAGFYDYGPPGCALLSNIVSVWRQHFVLEEDMHEVDCAIITPQEVLQTSGHTEKFVDWVVRDEQTGEILRADHVVAAVLRARLEADREARGDGAKKCKKRKRDETRVLEDDVKRDYEAVLARIDALGGEQLGNVITRLEIKNPETGNVLSKPTQFNLMFETTVGPTGQLKGYLRPETAQSIFLNFKKLLEFNQGRMPFAAAQVGRAFRNETRPRQGLLRLREFTMAEIEHFVNPEDKSHRRFAEVSDVRLRLLPASDQVDGRTEVCKITVGRAVETKIVDNETLGYFMARIQLFLTKIGIHPEGLRFRQHMRNEMAHYARDCWDAEILTSYGWMECVGCADRSAYDLTVHTQRTGIPLVVRERLEKPVTVECRVPVFNRKRFGVTLRNAARPVEERIKSMGQAELMRMEREIQEQGSAVVTVDGADYRLTEELFTINKREFTETTRDYVPSVIEPSFGLGRILYALVEHIWWTRDAARNVLSFPSCVAPWKVTLLPLSAHESLLGPTRDISKRIRSMGMAMKVDDTSASIGKRYARNDELGTPFSVTVDFQSLRDGTVTLRERDSMKQIREKTDVILEVLRDLVEGAVSWEQAAKSYAAFTEQELR